MAELLDDVTIRIADVDDAGSIARVHVRSWQEAYEGIVPADYLASLDPDVRTRQWTEHLRQGPHDHVRTWIAELPAAEPAEATAGGAPGVVGFLTLGPSRDEDADRRDLEIYSIYLDPGMWGRGIARDLVRTVLGEVSPRTPVSLWVLAANERARHFYRRHGFQPDGTERYEDVGGAELLEVRYRRG